jgi:hypothetical protein
MANEFDLSSLFGGGGTPSGLDALLSEEQRKLLGRNAVMSAAAALLQASGRSAVPISLGQALGGALQAGQGAYEKGRASSFQDLLLNAKLQEAKSAQDLQKQIAGVFAAPPAALSPEQQALMAPVSEAGPFGPKVARAELAASIQPPSADEILASQYRRAAQISTSAGKAEDAKRYMDIAKELNPRAEVIGQPFEVTDPKGNPILVQQYKDGTTKTMTGYGPKRDVVLQALGGQTIAIDKSKLKGNETFAQTMTPSEIANLGIAKGNLAVAQGGLNLRQQEFNRGAFDVKESPEGYAYIPKTPGAAAIPIMGATGEQLKGVSGGKPTEGERKAATLLSRMQLAQTQMDQGKPGMPGFFTSMTPRVGLPEERKRVEDAQLDFLDSALTLATGAAYTEFQLKGAMQSYFPKFGDDATTIAEKELRRKNLMEAARISAGTMSGAVPPVQGGGGGGAARPSLNNIFGTPGGR